MNFELERPEAVRQYSSFAWHVPSGMAEYGCCIIQTCSSHDLSSYSEFLHFFFRIFEFTANPAKSICKAGLFLPPCRSALR